MLTLTRREQQQIMIGDNIIITVVRIGRRKVRIGIDAPREIPVVRHDAWRKEPRREASETPR